MEAAPGAAGRAGTAGAKGRRGLRRACGHVRAADLPGDAGDAGDAEARPLGLAASLRPAQPAGPAPGLAPPPRPAGVRQHRLQGAERRRRARRSAARRGQPRHSTPDPRLPAAHRPQNLHHSRNSRECATPGGGSLTLALQGFPQLPATEDGPYAKNFPLDFKRKKPTIL